jgi:hypothetical protein
LACLIEESRDTFAEGDHARDHDDHARDHDDHARDHDDHARDHPEGNPFVPLPGHEYAYRYPDPITGHPLQIWPRKSLCDFESEDDFWKWLDAVSRYNNNLPPPRPMPSAETVAADVPAAEAPRLSARESRFKSRHVGVRLTQRDFSMLKELAIAHSVPPGTMARMLIVRGVRAAADKRE